MNTKSRLSLYIFFLISTIFFAVFSFNKEKFTQIYNQVTDYLAATFFAPSITVEEIKSAYDGIREGHQKVKILIVPGHEPNSGGTEYKGAIERDMAVILAEKLSSLLKENEHYSVFVSRDFYSWNEPLKSYLENNKQNILTWRNEQESTMNKFVDNGLIKRVIPITHGTANKDDTIRLYGAQKWANEEDFDIVLHLHVNDYPRKGSEKKYTGLSIYVPENQYSNAYASTALAREVFKELNTVLATSTLKAESSGIVPDQEIIAIGRFNTGDTANILIEYGYIYEPQYQTKEKRNQALTLYARKTYDGIENFFVNDLSE